jgi:integrase
VRGSLTQWGGAGSGKWRLRVFDGRDAQGKPITVSRNFTGSRRAAESALAKLVADVDRDQTKSHKGTLGDLLDRWLDDIEPHRSRYTMREHRRSVDKRINPALGSVRLDRLNAKNLDDFYRSLHKEGLSPASVRRYHSILSAALGRAVKWDWIPSNPADKASPPGPSRSKAQAPPLVAIQTLITKAQEQDPVLALAIALAATTGARRGELCALRWSDVDWERRTIKIDQSVTAISQEITVGETKTHQRRDIAIDESVIASLRGREVEQNSLAREIGVTLVDDPFILSRAMDGSTPCRPDTLTGAYRRLTTKLGVGGHFHELRHFAATTAVASGTDIRTVSHRLGHSDPRVTLKVYAHAVEARDRELASLLGQAVLGK